MNRSAGPYRGGHAPACAVCRGPIEATAPAAAEPPDYWESGIDGRPLAGQTLDPRWLERWYPVAECKGCGHLAPDLTRSYEGIGGAADLRASLAQSHHHEVARRFLVVAHLFAAHDPREAAVWILRAAWANEAAGIAEAARGLRLRAAAEIERALSYGLVLAPRVGATSAVLAEVLRLAEAHDRAAATCLRGINARPADLEHAFLFAIARGALERSSTPVSRRSANASLRERNPFAVAAEFWRALDHLPSPPLIRLVTPSPSVVAPTDEEAVTFARECANEELVWDLLRARWPGVWQMISVHRALRHALVRALTHGDRLIVEQAVAVLSDHGVAPQGDPEVASAISEAFDLEPRSAAVIGRLSSDRDPIVAQRALAVLQRFVQARRAREQASLAAIDTALGLEPGAAAAEPVAPAPPPPPPPSAALPREVQPASALATTPSESRARERSLLVVSVLAWRTRREPDLGALSRLARLYVEEGRRVEAILAHEALVRLRPDDGTARDTLTLLRRFDPPRLEPGESEPEELRELRRQEYESDPEVLAKLGPFTGEFERFEARHGPRALRRALERLAEQKLPLHCERMTRELARSLSDDAQASIAIYELCAAAGERFGAELETARDAFLGAAADITESARLSEAAPADELRDALSAFVSAHEAHALASDASRTTLLRLARAWRSSDQRVEALLAYEAAFRIGIEHMEVSVSISELRKLAAAARGPTEGDCDERREATAELLRGFERYTERADEPTLRGALERVAAEAQWTLGTNLAVALARSMRRTNPLAASALDALVAAVPAGAAKHAEGPKPYLATWRS